MRWPFSTKQTEPIPYAQSAGVEAAIGTSVPIDRLSADMLKEYVRSIYLWRSIDMIGAMASSVPLVVATPSTRALSNADQQVQGLLTKPNPQWTGGALQYFCSASLAAANKAYLMRVRGNAGVTLELWPINANEVENQYVNGSKMLSGFKWTGTGHVTNFPIGDDGDCDLIYFHRPALNKQTDKSPAAVAAAPAEVFTRVLQRCADIVSNSSNITGLLSTDKELAKPQVQAIKDRIERFKTGSTESGGTLVTANAKWSMTRLSEDPASALSVEIKDSLARDVVMTFGVPTQLVGLPGTDTYNNLAMARVGFLTDTVLPGYINLYVAGLNQALLRNSGSLIRPDLDRLPAMTAARLQLTETASKATMLSVNEQRALLGYPAYDDATADVPVLLEEMNLKRLAIEVQGGNVANILDKQPT